MTTGTRWCNCRLPQHSDEEEAGAEREACAWLFSTPVQAHARACGGDAGTAASLAAADAAAEADHCPDAPRLAKLKADLLRVERTLPEQALTASWDAAAWRQVCGLRPWLQHFPCC